MGLMECASGACMGVLYCNLRCESSNLYSKLTQLSFLLSLDTNRQTSTRGLSFFLFFALPLLICYTYEKKVTNRNLRRRLRI